MPHLLLLEEEEVLVESKVCEKFCEISCARPVHVGRSTTRHPFPSHEVRCKSQPIYSTECKNNQLTLKIIITIILSERYCQWRRWGGTRASRHLRWREDLWCSQRSGPGWQKFNCYEQRKYSIDRYWKRKVSTVGGQSGIDCSQTTQPGRFSGGYRRFVLT